MGAREGREQYVEDILWGVKDNRHWLRRKG